VNKQEKVNKSVKCSGCCKSQYVIVVVPSLLGRILMGMAFNDDTLSSSWDWNVVDEPFV